MSVLARIYGDDTRPDETDEQASERRRRTPETSYRASPEETAAFKKRQAELAFANAAADARRLGKRLGNQPTPEQQAARDQYASDVAFDAQTGHAAAQKFGPFARTAETLSSVSDPFRTDPDAPVSSTVAQVGRKAFGLMSAPFVAWGDAARVAEKALPEGALQSAMAAVPGTGQLATGASYAAQRAGLVSQDSPVIDTAEAGMAAPFAVPQAAADYVKAHTSVGGDPTKSNVADIAAMLLPLLVPHGAREKVEAAPEAKVPQRSFYDAMRAPAAEAKAPVGSPEWRAARAGEAGFAEGGGPIGVGLTALGAPAQAVIRGAQAAEGAVGRAFDKVAGSDAAQAIGSGLDRAAGKAGFRYNDPLSQFAGPEEGAALDTYLARERNAEQGASHTAAETARGLQNDFAPWESEAINKYLTAKNDLQMVRQGKQVAARPAAPEVPIRSGGRPPVPATGVVYRPAPLSEAELTLQSMEANRDASVNNLWDRLRSNRPDATRADAEAIWNNVIEEQRAKIPAQPETAPAPTPPTGMSAAERSSRLDGISERLARDPSNAGKSPAQLRATAEEMLSSIEATTAAPASRVLERPELSPDGTPVLDQSGKPKMRPTTEADLLKDIRDSSARFVQGPGGGVQPRFSLPERERLLKHEETKFRDWMDSVRFRLQDAGEEVANHPDYVHRVVEDFNDEQYPLFGRGRRGEPAVAATKERIGSTRSTVENPYQTGAVADFQSRKLQAAKQLEREILHRNDLTTSVTADTFDPKKHALYDFKTGASLYGPAAENQIAHGLGAYRVLDEKMVRGLDAANKVAEPSKSILGAIWDKSAGVAQTTQLLLSPSFQSAQWIADYITHLSNMRFSEMPEFTRRVAKQVPILLHEYGKSLGIGREGYAKSAVLERGRQLGQITEIMENLFDRGTSYVAGELVPRKVKSAYESVFGSASKAKVVADKSLPLHLRKASSIGEALHLLWSEYKDAMGALGQVRETALKKAHAEILGLRTGADKVSETAAINWTNRISGNYWKKTDLGRTLSKIDLFAKWFAEQVTRLTRDIAKNPATGRSDWNGLTSGPAPKIAATALMTWILNNRNDKTRAAAANLASRDSTAIVVDVNDDGDPLVVVPETLSSVAAKTWHFVKEAVTHPFNALKDAANSFLSGTKANPIAKAASLLFRDTPRDEEGLTSAEKAAQVRKRGGFMPTSGAQELADTITGGPGRIVKAALNKDTDTRGMDLARAFGATPGFPTYRRDRADRVAEERARYGGDYWQQLIDNARAPNKTAETNAKARAAAKWLIDHGVTEQGIKSVLGKGARNAHEAEELTRQERQDLLRRPMRVAP